MTPIITLTFVFRKVPVKLDSNGTVCQAEFTIGKTTYSSGGIWSITRAVTWAINKINEVLDEKGK